MYAYITAGMSEEENDAYRSTPPTRPPQAPQASQASQSLSLALLASATKPLNKLHFDLFYSARFSDSVVSVFLAY